MVGKSGHGRAHVHGIAAESVELGDDQHVAGLQPVGQAREASALGDGDAAGDGLGHDPAGLDAETRGLDFLSLVVSGLTEGGDANVGEGARYGADSSEKGIRNLPHILKPEQPTSGQGTRRCPETDGFGQDLLPPADRMDSRSDATSKLGANCSERCQPAALRSVLCIPR